MKQKKLYNGIDIMKLVSAICIVLLHTIETTAWYPCEVKFVFTRFAVPFFFIVSGFFLYKGLERNEDKKIYIVHYEKHIGKLFLIWAVIIYSPITIYTYAKQGNGALRLVLTCFRRMFVIGPGPYWYLLAMMWSAVFLYYCYVRKSDIIVALGITVGLTLSIMYSCFQGALDDILLFRYLFRGIYIVFSYEFNFIMYGIPFMGIGYLIAKNDFTIKRSTAVVGCLIFTLLRFFEYNLPKIFESPVWDANSISIAYIGQAICLFLFAKEWQVNVSKERAELYRKLSSWIYFTHAIILYNVLDPLMDHFTDFNTYDGSLVLPKMIVVIGVCIGMFAIIKRVDNKYLNILMNG